MYSSPRTRRYFLLKALPIALQRLFSAHAEVFPLQASHHNATTPLLRARGGISSGTRNREDRRHSSPRTRRYFQDTYYNCGPASLFSAHAEVFPFRASRVCFGQTLLRARGGISELGRAANPLGGSSPRTRRYFLSAIAPKPSAILFSAHAEGFPSALASSRRLKALLRARGGISRAGEFTPHLNRSSPRTRRYFLV